MLSSVSIGERKLITKSIGSAPIVKQLLSFPGQRVISFFDSEKTQEIYNLCPVLVQLVSVTNNNFSNCFLYYCSWETIFYLSCFSLLSHTMHSVAIIEVLITLSKLQGHLK